MDKTRILIVEDELITANDFEESLQSLGYEVTGIAKSGSETFGQIKKDSPDLVLMDLKLQGEMDGVEVADQIRTEFNIPVVYLTAYADKATLDRIKKTEPFGFITKPFDDRELQGVIETALYKHQMDMKIRENEKKLSIRNQQYRTFFENDLFGIWRVDFKEPVLSTLSHNEIATQILETGYIAECNDLLVQMYGLKSKDEFVGKPIKELVIDREAFLKKLAKVVENNFRAEMVDTEEIDSKGNIHIFRNSYFGHVHNQKLQWLWGFQLDVTERKRAEGALKKSEDQFRQFFEANPAYSYMVSQEGKIIDVNRSALAILGYTKDEILGKPLIKTIYSPESQDKAKKLFKSWKENGYIRNEEITIISKSGVKRTVVLNVDSVRDHQGHILYSISIQTDITDIRRTEEILRVRETKMSSIFRAAPIGIGVVSNRVILEVNDRFCEMTGYSNDELIGKNARMIYPTNEDYEYVGGEKYKQIKERGTGTVETRFRRKDGKIIDVLLSSTSLDPSDPTAGITFTVLDITERKRGEGALKQSEEKFRTLAEQSPNMIFINQKGRVVYANEKSAEVLGYTREEFYAPDFDFRILIAPESLEKVKSAFARHMKGEDIEPYDYALLTKDGKKIEVIITSKLIDYEGDRAILGIVTDITERKQAEEQLTIFKKFAETSSLGHGFADLNGDIIYINPTLCRMLGEKKQEDALGKNVSEYYPDDIRPRLANEILPTVRSEGMWYGELPLMSIQGDIIQSIQNISLINDEKGNPLYFGNAITDITKHKRAEEQIQKDLIEKKVLLKEIHHRVKNNLQIISSLLGLQSRHIEDKKALKVLEESRNRIRSIALVHENLYRSKDFANVDFGKYIKNLTDQLVKTYMIDSSKIKLDVEVEEITLGIDQAVPFGLVMNELVSNTLKHAFPPSFKGKNKIQITLRSMGADEIELIVKDNGVGIPKELDIRKTELMGMQLVFILAEDQLGGTVRLDRKGGTKFTFRFKRT